ncbi:hypothetical protein E6C50_02775 [Flavobacterium supellecticarium]|uniref:YD repeat-containing protein n=1 Tax=Flavobacterium supellecticarium TaxID=2565924 RepID=A0A4S4A5D0_9FLAO|nr:hypothetical protein [Flavobacterium supellecticarium]THF53145.1 hypothetical protein E6C50_02775 [Flavobacterium supellecticarium]
MKKILFTLLLLGLYGITMAQEAFPESPTALVVPQITNPSVDAQAITKFGDIPISEYTGMVNAAIPLYTLKSGNLSLPINLDYNAAGVKVSQTATWTGINWVLNAGGVITRTVHDKGDEADNPDGRMTADTIVPAGFLNGSAYAGWINLTLAKRRKLVDIKPDIFYFNFPGYSGSFFLDKQFKPRLVKADSNLKIEIVGTDSNLRTRLRQSNEFCITTPEGVKYYFGGDNATETSFLGNRIDNPYVPTGYYLTKIQHPISGTITLEYLSDSVNRNIRLETNESVTVKIAGLPTEHRDCIQPAYSEMSHDINTSYNIIASGKTLSKIKGNQGATEITFNSTPGSATHYRKVLNSIVIKEDNTILNTIDLNYYFPQTQSTSERFFLTKVEFNKNKNYGSGRKYEQYELEYFEPNELPNRDSQAKDVLGYYNGKWGNTIALPKNFDHYFHNYYSNFADRSSDLTYAVKGALKKIIFPTKGYSEFEYEMVKSKELDYGGGVQMNIWRNNPGRNPVNKTSTTASMMGDSYQNPDGTFGFLGVYMDQTIKGIANIISNSQMGHTDVIVLKITDITDNTVQNFTFRMPDGNQEIGSGSYNFSIEFTFDIRKDHKYSLQLSNNYQFSTTQFDAEVYFAYVKGVRLVDDGPLRVKRVTDYNAETENAYIKRYYYSSLANLNKNPLELAVFKKNYAYTTDWALVRCCSGGSEGSLLHDQQWGLGFRTLSSQSQIPLNQLEGKYEEVIVSFGGDNFELGGKYKRFYNVPLAINEDLHVADGSVFQQERNIYFGNAEDIYHGTLMEETDLIKRGNSLNMVRQQTYKYQYEDIANISGIIGGYCYYNCLFPASSASSFDLAKYTLIARKKQLIQKKTVDFVGPTLSTAITTTEDYHYGSLIGLPTSIISSTSEDGLVSYVNYVYADQPHLITNATPIQNAAMAKLLELNMISEPMMVKTFKGPSDGLPTAVGTKVTLFKSWNNNPNRILPEIVRFSKGTGALEDRILIEKYDGFGNMAQVRQKDGSRTYYQYNGRNQLMLKIENYIPVDSDDTANPIPLPELTPGSPCGLSQSYPGSIVTFFYYDAVTKLLARTVDTNCRNTYYEYDSLLRLKRIKDHDGNIIEEYDTNYRTN